MITNINIFKKRMLKENLSTTFDPNQQYHLFTMSGKEIAHEVLDEISSILENVDFDDVTVNISKDDISIDWAYTILTPEICQKWVETYQTNDEHIDQTIDEQYDIVEKLLFDNNILVKNN